MDLRYNEMWNDWDGTDESKTPKEESIHGNLVLSWKKINVHVKQTTQKFFQRSKTSYKQILHNGEYEMLALDWYRGYIIYFRSLLYFF